MAGNPPRGAGGRAAPPGPGFPDFEHRRHVVGRATVRRVARWGFPAFELVGDDGVLAAMGRFSWLNIFLGPGQRIELQDGTRWRIRSVGAAGAICPVVVDSSRRKIALAGLGVKNYGINGRDYACVLNPDESRRIGRANRWALHYFESELGIVTRRPMSVTAHRPLPLGAVLLSLVLVRYGIPGESAPRLPQFRWK